MDTPIAYQIVEDTSPIAYYKPTRILITKEHYYALVNADLLKATVFSEPHQIIGRITKRQLQYHTSKMAHDLKKLSKHIADAPQTSSGGRWCRT